MRGYIYILTNPAMPGLIKIGCTGRLPDERMKELSSHTGVPAPFKLEYWAEAEKFKYAEKLIHTRLRSKRFNKEFFQCSVATAVATLEGSEVKILRTYLVAEQQESVQSERKLFYQREREIEERNALLRREQLSHYEYQKAKDKWLSRIVWPVGLAATFCVLVVIPTKIPFFVGLILSVVAGCITGLVVGNVIAGFLVKNQQGLRGPLDASSTSSTQPRQASETQNMATDNSNHGFKFKWWYLLLIGAALKAISVATGGS